MNTLVLDVTTPNHDGPDGSYTRLLIAPIIDRLISDVRDLQETLQLARRATKVESVATQARHAYLIRPSLATDKALSKHLDDLTRRVHATGVANLATPVLSMDEIASLRDETGAVAGISLTRNPAGQLWLRWKGYFEGETSPVLAWESTPIRASLVDA